MQITAVVGRNCGMPRPDNIQIINLFAWEGEAGRAMAQSLQVEGYLVDKQQVLWDWPGSLAGCGGRRLGEPLPRRG